MLGGLGGARLGGGLIEEQGYCLVEDVETILETHFTDDGRPTYAEVFELVRRMTERIEVETGHAWRSLSVADEYHDGGTWVPGWGGFGWERSFKLNHRKIRQVSAVAGDRIECWDGGSWVDLVATKTEGRGADYWLDYDMGLLYIRTIYPPFEQMAVRASYHYGEVLVPGDVRLACAKMVAIEVVRGENRIEIVTEGTMRVPWDNRVKAWGEEAGAVLDRHKEYRVVLL